MRGHLLFAVWVAAMAAGCGDNGSERQPQPSAGPGATATTTSGTPSATTTSEMPSAAPKPEAIRDCASRIEGGKGLTPMPRRDVIAGPITFYGLSERNRVAVRDPSEAFKSINREYKPIKTVTEVRAGTVVTIAVAAEDRRRAALLYRWPSGNRARGFRLDEGQTVVRFESCPEDKRRFSGRGVVGPRTQFNGGFLFTEPECLRLNVYNQTRRTARRHVVPYGRPRSACER